ncbi:HNH endonuclease [Vibrio parahaemolyticus]|nr:HNH endonuclease [Vibrio parahaemolyticus]
MSNNLFKSDSQRAGGLDILENTVALCPNCHRELHFG